MAITIYLIGSFFLGVAALIFYFMIKPSLSKDNLKVTAAYSRGRTLVVDHTHGIFDEVVAGERHGLGQVLVTYKGGAAIPYNLDDFYIVNMENCLLGVDRPIFGVGRPSLPKEPKSKISGWKRGTNHESLYYGRASRNRVDDRIYHQKQIDLMKPVKQEFQK